MYPTKAVLLAAALAGTTLSYGTDSPECTASSNLFISIAATEAPATPTAILSFLSAHRDEIPAFTMGDAESHQSELCGLAAALPDSLLPQLATLGSELMVFAHAHSSQLNGYLEACAADATVASSSSSYFNSVIHNTGNICTETKTAEPTATATATPACGAGSGSGPAPTTLATSYQTY
ncbi:hypothetical protein F4808DRAFT_213516 [Astrocystis sublimbata]|nr:hypothetical protein F4808DRAFT_213516 [Astrocystis sublimbata]